MSDEVKKKKKKRRRKKISTPVFVLGVCSAVMSVMLLPTTIILLVGMLPTIAAVFSSRRGRRSQAVSVGAMNFAGCSPFLFQLWLGEHVVSLAVNIISDPFVIVIMYGGAAVGYVIDWALGSFIGMFIYEKNIARVATIEKNLDALKERWGEAVSGEIELDQDGFPIEGF